MSQTSTLPPSKVIINLLLPLLIIDHQTSSFIVIMLYQLYLKFTSFIIIPTTKTACKNECTAATVQRTQEHNHQSPTPLKISSQPMEKNTHKRARTPKKKVKLIIETSLF